MSKARISIGGGARAMISRGLAAEGRQVAPAELEKMFADFIAHYSAHIADRSRPFPGVERALEQLADGNFILAVCTNKLEGLSRAIARHSRISPAVSPRSAARTRSAVQKPDPIMLQRTIAAAGGDANAAIMVGDSNTDMLTARAPVFR